MVRNEIPIFIEKFLMVFILLLDLSKFDAKTLQRTMHQLAKH